MKRALLLTGHFAQQKRRGSMLWVSEHLQRMGWHVTLATVGYSWLSHLTGDPRLRALAVRPKPGVREVSNRLTTLYRCPPVHPVNLRYRSLNRLVRPWFSGFVAHWACHLRPHLAQADLVICESGPPALLAPVLARAAAHAPRIYRVNDDIRLLNAAPVLVDAERASLHHFTRISTASPHLAQRFAAHPNVTIDPMGIPRDRLKVSTADPYRPRCLSKIAVCAGTTQIDLPALERIATERPNWQIHILGRLRTSPPALPNIHWLGEQPFDTTLRFTAYADIGLAPYTDRPGIEYQSTQSNRILLYRAFGLPTLGPDRLTTPAIPSIIGYSEEDAYARCESWTRQPEPIPDWSELALSLTQNGVTEPESDVSTDPARIVKSRVKTVPALASSA